MSRQQATIRFGNEHDIPSICDLERRVWSSRGVLPIDQNIVQTWVTTHPGGFLVGEHQARVRGYAYFEYLSYDLNDLDEHWPPANMPLTIRHHDPQGSAMYGISAAADFPGLGAQLFAQALEIGAQQGKTRLATLIRMQGLSRFLGEIRTEYPEARDYSDAELALWYAMRCIRSVGGDIASNLAGRAPPDFFPEQVRKDSVLTYPAHVARMTLHAIVPSSFNDRESANLLALATFPAL